MDNETQMILIDSDEISTSDQQERNQIREEYKKRLAEKLKDPEFRKIEGFPLGTDEAILALSDPPYYTACPNPFIEEWLAENAKPYDPETDNYHREPFVADVSEGKNDPIYNAHSYHTKVPHKAIMRYILHYTEPGDIVFDGFCGTGMTGVAAQMCGNKAQVESLGYKVMADDVIVDKDGKPLSKLGIRKAILNDLSPAATFIACNYNAPIDVKKFECEAIRILTEVEKECGWMYETKHSDGRIGKINYTVWSDVFVCPECSREVIFWNAAVDKEAKAVRDEFPCPHCFTKLSKRNMERAWISRYDSAIKETIRQAKQVPVLINYTMGRKRIEKIPDSFDLALIEKIEASEIPYWFPTERMLIGRETRRNDPIGITHVHHFFSKRNLWMLGALCEKSVVEYKLILQAIVATLCSKLVRYNLGNRGNGNLSGTLYISSLIAETEITKVAMGKVKDFVKAFIAKKRNPVSCLDFADASMKLESIDYLFIDPPFGANLNYSELNFIWESWLRVWTNNKSEAIENITQGKGLNEYRALMTACFNEAYRMLKPGRWMTVEFSNTKAAVWNSIQTALIESGFIVANVAALDKQQGSFKAVTTPTAVKQDLVISCYKPQHEFEMRFKELQGQPQGVVEFIRQHLNMLPVVTLTDKGVIETIIERTKHMLFDRMIAYHLQRNASIPISILEFQNMLDIEFIERDEMYFLPNQAARYDATRARNDIETLSLFISDERTAVQWIRTKLYQEPQTLGELTPKFMQEIQTLDNYEMLPELRDLLKENFIANNDNHWRIPDPDSEKDIEAMRLKTLLQVFQTYTKSKGQLKTFRKEAIIEGFRHCWKMKQYNVIVAVCEKIPAKTLQDIQEFVQFYDIAKDLAPEIPEQLEFTWEA
ncbi:MAG: DNA methyltransferase [Armatimonadota bacterium]